MRKLSAILAISVLMLQAPAYSKDKESSKKGKVDKKQALVDQIVDAVEAQKLSSEERAELKKKNNERMDRFVDLIAEKTNMGEEAKNKIKEKLAEKREKAGRQMPPELKEKLAEKFESKTFCKETTVTVLSDHFDEKDLRAILKFLKSSTGKKLLKQGPDMISQGVELAAVHYVPIIIDLLKEMKSKLPPGLGPGGTPEQKREMMDRFKQMLQEKLKQKQLPGQGKDET